MTRTKKFPRTKHGTKHQTRRQPKTPPRTIVIRDGTDLLAAMAVAFGFVPEQSVTMLAIRAERPFHARVDLPADPADLPEVVESIVGPLLHHGAELVAFVVYSDDAEAAETAGRLVLARSLCAGLQVLEVLIADGRACRPLSDPGHPPAPWQRYDLGSHPIVADAVLAGEVVLGSRAELAGTLAADPPGRTSLAAALALRPPIPLSDSGMIRRESAWSMRHLGRLLRRGERCDDQSAGRLLRAVAHPLIRDAVMGTLDTEIADAWVQVWRDLTRRAPEEVLAPAASILGMGAWAAGDGALAWCAHDRAHEGTVPCGLTGVLAELLTRAVPPSSWSRLREVVWSGAEPAWGELSGIDLGVGTRPAG